MRGVLRRTMTVVGRWLPPLGLATVVVCVLLTLPIASATGSETEPVVQVEEDWKLVLNDPDDAIDAPQFHTMMSPYSSVDTLYLQASWNYWERPSFSSGGLQMQAWWDDWCLVEKGFFNSVQLSTDAETITWTQRLSTNGEVLSFQIDNGQSQTWGEFGGDNMKLQGYVHVPDLNGYSPEVSVGNSWVTYGCNRVDLLVITEVRYYGASGLLCTDTTPRVVFDIDAQ